MEKKLSKKPPSDDSVKKTDKPSQEITMDAFIVKCIGKGRLKAWQHKEIAVFFRDMKLREKEDQEVYEATLKKY